MNVCRSAALALLATVVCLPGRLSAQGLALSGIGAVNQGMGGAATAAPIDSAGALHWNPASISGLKSSEVSFGVAFALPSEEVESSLAFPPLAGKSRGEPGVSPLPHLAWVEKGEDSPLTIGLGVFAIGGFRTNYSASLSNPVLTPPPPVGVGVGRVVAEAEFLQIAPTAAYALTDYFSIGVAPTITMARLRASPFLFAAPDDANGDNIPSYPDGSGNRWVWGGGFQVGAYYIGPGAWHFGAAVKSPQWFEKARFKSADELGRPRDVSFSAVYPLIVSVGTSYDGIERLLLACDVRYFDYGHAKGFAEEGFDGSGALRGLGWRSVLALAMGAQYKVNDYFTARVGYSFNQNPVSNAATGFNVATPVISQHFVYTGFSLAISQHSIVSLTYVHAFENQIEGPIQTPLGPIPGSRVASSVSLDAIAVATTVRY